MKTKNSKIVKLEIIVNKNNLTLDEVNFLKEIIETQKIEVESLTTNAKKNKSIKKSLSLIESLAQKFSSSSQQFST